MSNKEKHIKDLEQRKKEDAQKEYNDFLFFLMFEN